MSKILAVLSFVALNLVDARHCLYDNRPLLESCGRGCLAGPGKASCVTRCLIGKRVRGSCARCLGNGFSCALRSCRSQCQGGFGAPGCTACVRRSCGLCSRVGKSIDEVNETEISQILAEVVFSAKPEELEQAFKSEELEEAVAAESKSSEKAEPAEPKSSVTGEQKLAEEKSSGCWENRRALKACGTQCFSSANRGQCARRCLRNTWHMSPNCANCFGDKVDCTIRNCLPKCAANSEAWKCTNCVRSLCGRCEMDKSDEMSDDVLNMVVELATATATSSSEASEKAFYP